MKKRILLLICILLALTSAALAENRQEAADITAQCSFDCTFTESKTAWLYDRRYPTAWQSAGAQTPSLTITAPQGGKIAGVYVCFGKAPQAWEIQVMDENGAWRSAGQDDSGFLHSYIALPEGQQCVRILGRNEGYSTLMINELYVLGEGERPAWVQVWEPTHEKADILFISTHSDDELIFFGGAIPTYAAEKQSKVVVAYFAPARPTRTSELLNGLWHLGVRHYPVLGTFQDTKAENMEDAYSKVGGKIKVNSWFVELYRKYKPEVVVTQDIEGEYGHTQHKIVAQAAIDAVPLAANGSEYPQSAGKYGAWEIRKLYLHLWPENQIVFDWEVPLQSMNGLTGMELADQAFTRFHITQAGADLGVRTTGLQYDNRVFGLVHTTVGEDVRKDDFLENIDQTP